MFSQRDKDIVFLQSECLLGFSREIKKPVAECVDILEAHGIFDYISQCYEYLHLSGTEYIVEDIAHRVREGVRFAAGS